MKTLKTTSILLLIPASFLAASASAVSGPQSNGVNNGIRVFGHEQPFRTQDLPESNLKKNLLALPKQAREKALSKLHKISFTDLDLKHLQTDRDGGIFYADEFGKLPNKNIERFDYENNSTNQNQFADPLFDTNGVFKLHSKSGSTNVIYIDFDGHVIENTSWNTVAGSTSLKAKAFNVDGDSNSFTDSEKRQIAEIWYQVAEDFAPFNVDVTTEAPAKFGPTTGHILITSKTDTDGKFMPYPDTGGVAYVDVWGEPNYEPYYSPALVYYDNLANYFEYIAIVASHEMGHNLGLSHDGFNNGVSSYEYYAGYAVSGLSWGPIMGAPYGANVAQWSKGEYTGATQLQDDIAIMTGYLGIRSDDHDSTGTLPSSLSMDASGQIIATNPENDPTNSVPDNKGIIESRIDIDYFAFNTESGQITITATPAWEAFYDDLSKSGGNLDIKLTLLTESGTALAKSDPAVQTDATINTTVSTGRYLIAVEGVGDTALPYTDYGSMGQYFISGSVDKTAPKANDISVTTKEDVGLQINLNSGNPGNVGLTYSIVKAPAHGKVVISGSAASYAPTKDYYGKDSFTYSVTDSGGKSSSATVSISVTSVNDAPVAQTSAKRKGNGKFRYAFSSDGSHDLEGDALAYRWDFGDGYSSNDANPVHKYKFPGNYTAQLTLTDAPGGVSKSRVDVKIKGCQKKINGISKTCPVGFTYENEPVEIDLDLGEEGLTYSIKKAPKYGIVGLSGHVATYTPATGYLGKDRFFFTVIDTLGKKKSMKVGINVVPSQ